METGKRRYRNIPKEIVVTYKMEGTAEQKNKIEDIVIELLVAKIKAISRKNKNHH